MNNTSKWLRIGFNIGVVLLVIGAIDPLEGSVVITAGSVLLAVVAWFLHDRHRKIFLTATLMILFGVFFLFYLSSLGGFGGSSSLPNWLGMLILPYPAGWLMIVVTLALRAFRKPSLPPANVH